LVKIKCRLRNNLFAAETKKLIVFSAFLALLARRCAVMVHPRLEEFDRHVFVGLFAGIICGDIN